MEIAWTEAKREKTLQERGLDFARAVEVFGGLHATRATHGGPAGETRHITAGFLDGRMVAMVWAPRGDTRHIISMRARTCQGTKALERRSGRIRTTRLT